MSGPGLRRSEWIYCLLLALATLKVYGDVFAAGFIRFDDPRYVTQNPHVVAGLTWDGATWAFTTLFKSNWHPLAWLSHMLDVELFGLDAGGHHATSLLLHTANSLLLFAVLRSATRAPGPSALVAALFALHPTHVESVAWIAERKDVLSTFFGLLATACYVGYARRGGIGRYAATAALLVLSLASKAMLVTLPFVFLLLDFWPLERLRSDESARRILVEKLPLLAVVAVIAGVTFAAQAGSGAVGLGDAVALPQRVANAVMSYGLYVGKTVWPADLALVYPHPYLPGGEPWRPWQVAVTGAGLALATWAVVRAHRRPYLLVGWFWYLGTLVPVIGLVQAGTQGMADRYTYVPCIGLYLMAAWGGADALRALGERRRAMLQIPALALTLLVVAALAFASQRQAAWWSDTVTLFERSLAVAPGSTFLRNNLANELYDAGNLDAAIVHYRRALEVDPELRVAHRNLANALRRRGEPYAAARHSLIGKGVPIDSSPGQLLLGDVRLEEGNPAAAAAHYRNALAHDATSDAAHRGLARALLGLGERAAAVAELHEVLRLAPGSPQDHLLLGHALRVDGDLDAAIVQYRAAVAAAPQLAATSQVLAEALLTRGDIAEAIVFYRRAVAADPRDAAQQQRLEAALRLQSEAERAEAGKDR
jgi:tetratricopeptide (TPR) repeat protein